MRFKYISHDSNNSLYQAYSITKDSIFENGYVIGFRQLNIVYVLQLSRSCLFMTWEGNTHTQRHIHTVTWRLYIRPCTYVPGYNDGVSKV